MSTPSAGWSKLANGQMHKIKELEWHTVKVAKNQKQKETKTKMPTISQFHSSVNP